MSTDQKNTKATTTESALDEYLSKLNVAVTSPTKAKKLLNTFAPDPRVVFCLVGLPGVGKSQIVKQIAYERGVPFPTDDGEDFTCPSQVIHVPQTMAEDISLPSLPAGANDGTYYDKRIPRRFQAVVEYATKNEAAIKAGKKGQPILFIEEPNRARERSVTAALFTVMEDRMIGDTRIPDVVQIVCAMNPGISGMNVNGFEKELAARRRLAFIGVAPSYPEFIDHAEAREFHPGLIGFIKANPTMLYDHQAAAAGQVYACPASYETVSDILKRLDAEGMPLNGSDARIVLASKIGITRTEALVDYLSNGTVTVPPHDILDKYTPTSDVRHRVKELVSNGRTDHLATLCEGLAMVIFHEQSDPKKFKTHVGLFMSDLPADLTTALIVTHFNAQAKSAPEGMRYWQALNNAFADVPAYNAAIKAIKKAQNRAKDAAAQP